MKKLTRLIPLMAAVVMMLTYSSCQKENGDNQMPNSGNAEGKKTVRTHYGPAVEIGNGVARAWVAEDLDGKPTAVGINMSEEALNSLPSTVQQYVLYFPNNAATHFYNHVLLDWNPQGHEPIPLYGVPHFDFHFYSITVDERMMIGPNDSTQFANAPAAKYQPPLYLQTPGGVPMMGAHWVDLLAPEFNNQPFSKTFIWGSYDGEFIFWEPMITRAYLLTHPNVESQLRQPSAFQHDGWYAQSYLVKYSTSPNEYTIALTNLTYQQGQ